MQDPIPFDRLALVVRRPIVWDRQLDEHAQGLETCLHLLLTAGGYARLNRVDDARFDWSNAKEQWCSAEDAATCLGGLREHLVGLGKDLPKLAGQDEDTVRKTMDRF